MTIRKTPQVSIKSEPGPLSRTALLDAAYDVPPLRDKDIKTQRSARVGEWCALTGEPIAEGEPVVEAESLLTSASSQPHEIFAVPDATHVTLHAARCYKHFRGGLTGNMLAIQRGDDFVGLAPMISNASADEQGRPSWQRLIYGVDPHGELRDGDRTLCIVTEEFQRRLWLDARVSRFHAEGEWSLYLYWTGTAAGSFAQNVTVHVPRLRAVLALCEHVYTLGFSKDALLAGLFHAPFGQVAEVGATQTRTLDAALDACRGSPEMLVACCVVQRADSLDALESPTTYRTLIPCLTPTPTSASKLSPQRSRALPKTSSASRSSPTQKPPASGSQTRLFD